MRLLTIRFQNLNSLRGTHEVNLERGPLAEAGLFAITGATGAGKSTILDAVTLALYGRAARYGKSTAEDMMSRGAAECMAAVEFECDSGRYTAAWMLKRSRNKAGGRLQPPKHDLSQDGGIIEEKTTGVVARVEALTGLDYERFLRSVLLAQGQFAAFLKADTKERADLLQRITGSQIYSELGRLAHEIAAANARELDMESARLSGIAFLAEEERAALAERITALNTELQDRAEKEAALQSQVAAAKRARLLHEQESALAAEEAAHRRAGESFAESESRLQFHAAALPFADLLRVAEESEKAHQDSMQAVADATAARAGAQGEAESAAGAAIAAMDASEAAAQQKLAALTKDRAANAQAISAQEEWLTLHKADAALPDALPLLAELKTEAGAAAQRKQEAEKLHVAAGARLAAETNAAEEKESAAVSSAQIATAAAAAADRADAAVAALLVAPLHSAEAVESENALLAKLTDALARLRTAVDAAAQQEQELSNLEVQCRDCEQRRATAVAANKAAADTLDAARREEALLQELVRKEEVIRSLEDHRAHLQAGEPCPLCGAAEHPWGGGDAPPADSAAVRLREQTEKVTLAAQASQSAVAALTSAEKAAAAAASSLETRRSSRAQQQQAMQADWRACFSEMEFSSAALAAAEEETARKFVAIQTLHQNVRAAVQTQRDAREIAAKRSEEARSARALADAARAAVQQANVAQQEAVDRLVEASRSQDAAAARLCAQIESYHEEPADTAGALDRLRKRAKAWQDARSQREELDKTAARFQNDADTLASDIQRRAELRKVATDAIHAAEVKPGPAEPGRRILFSELQRALTALHTARSREDSARAALAGAQTKSTAAQAALDSALSGSRFSTPVELRAALLDTATHAALARRQQELRDASVSLASRRSQLEKERAELLAAGPLPDHAALPALEESLRQFSAHSLELRDRRSIAGQQLKSDDDTRARHAAAATALEEKRTGFLPWARLAEVIGNADGSKFSRFAQSLTLDVLLALANARLHHLCDRYRLTRSGAAAELDLQISDAWQGDALRPMESLSGGETFLVSLALALALSELAGRRTRIATLFIDEGFGTLDAVALDTALSALESLRTAHSTIGVISHVESLKSRLTTQVEVSRGPGGWSTLLVKY